MAATKALVIGIDDYGGPPNELTCCVKDAEAFARVLKSYGFEEVHSLRDADATLEKLDEQLRWLFQGRKSEDRIVLYFSGLGFTRSRNGVVDECLVLRNGLADSERLLSSASDLPAGILTTILDTSFSGASEQFVVDASAGRAAPQGEIVRGKVWQPTPDERTRFDIAQREQKVTEYRQLALSGLSLCASRDAESAAANTSRTDGHSAFTHALVTALRQVGPQATTPEVIAATRARLRALGFQQTPRLIEQAAAGDLRLRRFLTLEPISAAEMLRVISEPRYWEGVLTAATSPFSSAWAVTQEVNQMTMQQPFTGAYQPAAYQQQSGAAQYHQPFGIPQLAGDDVSRTISAIGPALATVIPQIVPQIVSSVLAQQRFGPAGSYAPQFGTNGPLGYAGLTPPFGAVPNALGSSPEDVQRLLPVLTPVLSSVIPAIVPQIVNNILAQQRAMSPWGAPHTLQDPWASMGAGVGTGTPIGFQNPYGFATPFGRI